jgi:hypothetical protein
MTAKQKEQFNRMRTALRAIACDYPSPDQLRKNSQQLYGLDADEAIEYGYENIRYQAKRAVSGVRAA